MPVFEFTSPEGKKYRVNGPEGATKEQAFGILQQQLSAGPAPEAAPASTAPAPKAEPAAPNNALMSANAANRAIAGIPDAVLNAPNRLLNLGKAAVGTVATALGRSDLAPEPTPDPDFVRKGFEKVGFIKPELDPATTGQRMLSSLVQGGVGAALGSPSSSLRQLATNAAVGGLSGAAAGATKEATGNDTLAMTAGMLTPAVASRAISGAQQKIAANQLRQQQNVVRDQTVADAQRAGFVISPSEVNPSTMNRALEGVAGKLTTRQLASHKNQEVTNRLVRQDLGIAEDAPLTPELMAQLRREAYQAGYAPVEAAGAIRPGSAFRNDLDKIAQQFRGAARSFPKAVQDEVGQMVDSLKVRQFDAADGVKMAQILRDESSKSYASGDKAMGKAQRSAATAIEDQIERGLQGMGQPGADMLDAFRAARRQMAKTHTVEAALNPATGNVQAQKLATELSKGKPLSGDIRNVAAAANAFPKNFQSMEAVGSIPGISPLDVFGGASLGALGAASTGPGGAFLAALPAARPVVRSALLSPAYQERFATPNYDVGAVSRGLAAGDLANPLLLSSLVAAQQQAEESRKKLRDMAGKGGK